jgi:type IV pilus assembly protein PilQ
MSKRHIFRKLGTLLSNLSPYLVVGILSWLHVPAYAQQVPPVLIDTATASQAIFNGRLLDIQFERLPDAGARTTLVFDSTDYQVELVESQHMLRITLPQIQLADEQLFTLNVEDFATPVKMIETFEQPAATVVEFTLTGATHFKQQRSGELLVIEIQQMDEEQQAAKNKYSGEAISLDFQDVPVRKVLQIIAQVNGFNLVTTDTVRGNVTVSLSNVPWDQALDMILKIKGLDKRLEGNILLIAPSEELAARETQQLQSRQQVAQLAPLKSVNVQINYAKALEIASILKNGNSSILSPRGTVAVDERTNTLLLRDTQASIDEARAMVVALDIPVKQVLIESRMVTVRDNAGEQLGVRWGFSDKRDSTGISGSLGGADSIASGTVPGLSDRLNVNLPVTNPAGRIGLQIARLVDGTILDLELSALESENKGEIIASPRITVANQHEAYIEQGTEIPYVQATSSGATSVEFKKAVLSLKVTPHITPDNRIILDLVVTQDTRGETVQTSTGPAIAIDTQEISTQVLVENGETIVLGGIFQQTSTNDVVKVPCFGDIPVFGHLFKNTSVLDEKRELLIFVTPKILIENIGIQ